MFNWLLVQLLRLVLIVLATVICFLPLELFLLFKRALSPVGFWQNLVTYGIGAWVGGSIQIALLLVWVGCIGLLTFGWSSLLGDSKRPGYMRHIP